MGRFARAAIVAAVALVVAAPAASAQGGVSVTAEPGGAVCGTPSVTNHEASGGCEIHVSSTELVDLETFGATITSCSWEFEAQLGSNGAGWLTHQGLTGGACFLVSCAEEGGGIAPWAASLAEVGGALGLTFAFCLQGSSTTNCTVTAPVAIVGHSATFAGETPELNCAGTGGLIQVHGNFVAEGGSFEIVH